MINVCDINVMKPLLAEHGFHFSKAKGQNFLIASWVPEGIARESGVAVGQLTMVMSGDGSGLDPYCAALRENGETVIRLLRGKQASEP